MAQQRADLAVVEALTPLCVKHFNDDPNAVVNKTELMKITNSWSQRDFIVKGGWATFGEKPNAELAIACANALTKAPA
jgi:hypothetical protein